VNAYWAQPVGNKYTLRAAGIRVKYLYKKNILFCGQYLLLTCTYVFGGFCDGSLEKLLNNCYAEGLSENV
jgi:hypothetical protein